MRFILYMLFGLGGVLVLAQLHARHGWEARNHEPASDRPRILERCEREEARRAFFVTFFEGTWRS